MAASTTHSAWQYSKWTWNIARNMRISEPTGAELAAVVTFIKEFRDPVADSGTRSWLDTKFKQKAIVAVASNTQYRCNIDQEPTHVLVELVGVIARNLDSIPITTAEAAFVDTLITATGDRRYGAGALFGGASGSLITV